MSKVDPDDDNTRWQLVLLQETKYVDLAKSLLQSGVIREFDPDYRNSWLEEIIIRSPIAILECFLNMRYTTITHDKELTLIHCALNSETPDSILKLKYLLEVEPSSLSKVTNYGSPLWCRGSNITCCDYLES